MSLNEKMVIESGRKCCGFKAVSEAIDCRFPKEKPCGLQIVSIQKDYLRTLGLLTVSVAAAEVIMRAS